MILSRFRWYRRMRGGYWAQVTSMFYGRRWVRCKERGQPTPDHQWEFFPWASKVMGNGYIDEWHCTDGMFATPLSTAICEDCKERLELK